MANARKHAPVVRFAALFSGSPALLDWGCAHLEKQWGPIVERSEDFAFDMTDYYEATMGRELVKRLVAFHQLIDPGELVEAKLQTNAWEQQCPDEPAMRGVERPLNIDPGYVSEAKVVLATMKDRDHRLYLGRSVFGEVTLYYQLPGRWQASRWTYADYRSETAHAFFMAVRERLRGDLRAFASND